MVDLGGGSTVGICLTQIPMVDLGGGSTVGICLTQIPMDLGGGSTVGICLTQIPMVDLGGGSTVGICPPGWLGEWIHRWDLPPWLVGGVDPPLGFGLLVGWWSDVLCCIQGL